MLMKFASCRLPDGDAATDPEGDRSSYYAPGAAAAFAIACLALMIAFDLRYGGFSLSGFSWPLMIVGLLIAALYGRLRQMDARLISMVSALATLFTTGLLAAIVQYTATAHGAKELVDNSLLAADQALGFDWFAFVGFFDRSRWVSDVLLQVYTSIGPQMLTLFVLFILRRDFEAVDACVIALVIMITVASFVCAEAPAIGVTGIVDVSFANTPVAGGRAGQPTFLALRSGALREIDLESMAGLITFPSGHAAFAVLAPLAARRIPFAFWPFVTVNALMLISTLTHGGHYLVDLFAGGALAVASWRTALGLAAWRPKGFSLLQRAASGPKLIGAGVVPRP